ncbi:unnamed protein product, partial [marine sediment metagenome]
MQTSKQIKRMSLKECAYPHCLNTFVGSQFKRFCDDIGCKEHRQLSRQKVRVKKTLPDVENRIISKPIVTRVLSMKTKVIRLSCKARNCNGKVCGK